MTASEDVTLRWYEPLREGDKIIEALDDYVTRMHGMGIEYPDDVLAQWFYEHWHFVSDYEGHHRFTVFHALKDRIALKPIHEYWLVDASMQRE